LTTNWNFELYINGEWTAGEAGGEIEVINPATEEIIGRVPDASTKDAVRAIEAARKAFDEGPWPYTKPAERAAALIRLAEALEARSGDLRELIVAETGSTGFLTDYVQAAGSIGMFRANAAHIEHVVEWVEAGTMGTSSGGMSGSALVREPVGVVGAITPFNFPFMLNVVKVAPALAAGCTVVLKPHQWTPLDAFLIAQAAEEAGIPPGVFNVITGGADVGEEMTTNPMVDMIAFTGSTATGRRIMANGAATMKRHQLELGGKSAQVVLDDVSEDYARTIGFGSVLPHCGQGCILGTRLLLPEHLLDAYKEGVAAMAPSITIGDPRDPSTVLGPLIREQQRERVEGYVQSGLDQGAELILGGKRPEGFDKGFFYEPTVFIGTNDMRIAQEEIFGPVLVVIPYDGDDNAVDIANDSNYGLCGSVWTADNDRGLGVARQVRTGTYMLNAPVPIDFSTPFGGYKESGVGREFGPEGLESFLEKKSIALPADFTPGARA
jgi:aldehyde dehydrogenase (NAD+)